MTILLPKTKSDQEGNNIFKRHIYANPKNPAICPVLGLALHIFSIGIRLEGGNRLVFGQTAQDRFSKWLKNTCTLNKESIEAMGILIGDIGTHSCRKGIASILSNNPGKMIKYS